MGLLNVNAIATYVSNLIKQTSDMNSCGVISGSVDEYVHLPGHLEPSLASFILWMFSRSV